MHTLPPATVSGPQPPPYPAPRCIALPRPDWAVIDAWEAAHGLAPAT